MPEQLEKVMYTMFEAILAILRCHQLQVDVAFPWEYVAMHDDATKVDECEHGTRVLLNLIIVYCFYIW